MDLGSDGTGTGIGKGSAWSWLVISTVVAVGLAKNSLVVFTKVFKSLVSSYW